MPEAPDWCERLRHRPTDTVHGLHHPWWWHLTDVRRSNVAHAVHGRRWHHRSHAHHAHASHGLLGVADVRHLVRGSLVHNAHIGHAVTHRVVTSGAPVRWGADAGLVVRSFRRQHGEAFVVSVSLNSSDPLAHVHTPVYRRRLVEVRR